MCRFRERVSVLRGSRLAAAWLGHRLTRLDSVTVSVTSTIFTTITRSATVTSTVVQNVVQTSSVVSTITTTVSNLATQTDVVFVTNTVVQKRWHGVNHFKPDPPLLEEKRDVPVVGPALQALRRFVTGADDGPRVVGDLARRQASTSRVTTTVFVTSTVDITSFATVATTVRSTSVFTTDILQTVTRYGSTFAALHVHGKAG